MSEDLSPVSRGGSHEHSDEAAMAAVRSFFEENRERVVFSRQVEVLHEDDWFHWITNRTVRELVKEGIVHRERRELPVGATVNLMWHRSYRYYKREAERVADLVAEYANPNIGAALGLHGEMMVLEGFASQQFVMHGREISSFRGREWTKTDHDLDFIFERDELTYGVEVKNKLGYMDREQLEIKIDICQALGVTPVFVARMLPKSWILDVKDEGGFSLIMKYQLYPWTHKRLADRVNEEFGLPVDAPRRIQDGTMERFVRWHEDRLRGM